MSYLPVGSNDTLSHLALPSAPETLCGKPVVKTPPTPYSADISEQNFLSCDICATLSGGGDSILKQTQAGRDCPHCEAGIDESGLSCWNCGGSGWLDEGEDQYAGDLSGLNLDDLRGTKVAFAPAQPSEGHCEKCGQENNVLVARDGQYQCVGCATAPVSTNWNRGTGKTAQSMTEGRGVCNDCGQPIYRYCHSQAGSLKAYAWSDVDPDGEDDPRYGTTCPQTHQRHVPESARNSSKTATNWTRDGDPIEDGFTVMITADQAQRTPFLDYTRVAVSDKRECPDCGESHWLSKIASCMECNGLKCSGCMESVGLDSFLGTCKKCADAPSDLAYETGYEDAYPDTDRYLSYLMQDEDAETDPLFLPDTYE